jgi:hypothetical protein
LSPYYPDSNQMLGDAYLEIGENEKALERIAEQQNWTPVMPQATEEWARRTSKATSGTSASPSSRRLYDFTSTGIFTRTSAWRTSISNSMTTR